MTASEPDAPIRSYRDLRVWQHAMELAEAVYVLARSFPREELFGLTSQARKAAGSVPANIAEGYGRGSRASYAHFVRVAQGSLKELETHMLLAERVGVAAPGTIAPLLEQADQLGRMLRRLLQKFGPPNP